MARRRPPTRTRSPLPTQTPGTSRTLLKVSLAGGPFNNNDAAGEGAGTREIEITFDGGNEGDDDLVLDGGPANVSDNWRMGAIDATHNGYQLDDAEAASSIDVDDLPTTNVEQLQIGVSCNPGNDTLDARGGALFSGPLQIAGERPTDRRHWRRPHLRRPWRWLAVRGRRRR